MLPLVHVKFDIFAEVVAIEFDSQQHLLLQVGDEQNVKFAFIVIADQVAEFVGPKISQTLKECF